MSKKTHKQKGLIPMFQETWRKVKAFVVSIPDRLQKLNLTLRRIIVLAACLIAIAIPTLIIAAIVGAANAKAMAAEPAPTQIALPSATSVVPPVTPTPTTQPTKEDGNTYAPDETLEPTPYASAVKVLQKRDECAEVAVLQSRLMELGYLDIDEPTNYFGTGTEYAVKLFQRQHELQIDGIAGEQTQAILFSDEAQKYFLKEGAEGDDVKMLQKKLNELGYLDEADIDSVYGAATISAVKRFQKRNHLTDDGLAGEKTLEVMYSDDAVISYELYKQQQAEAANKTEEVKEEEKNTPTHKERFLTAAKSKLGCEYVLGDSGPDTFDCSGFVYWCLRQAGVSCKRLNASGFSGKSDWTKITDIDDLQKGDIIFYRSDESDRVSHCGIYVGSNQMIDASSGNGKVVRRSLSSYWKRNFVCARRPWK